MGLRFTRPLNDIACVTRDSYGNGIFFRIGLC